MLFVAISKAECDVQIQIPFFDQWMLIYFKIKESRNWLLYQMQMHCHVSYGLSTEDLSEVFPLKLYQLMYRLRSLNSNNISIYNVYTFNNVESFQRVLSNLFF